MIFVISLMTLNQIEQKMFSPLQDSTDSLTAGAIGSFLFLLKVFLHERLQLIAVILECILALVNLIIQHRLQMFEIMCLLAFINHVTKDFKENFARFSPHVKVICLVAEYLLSN